MGTILDPSYKVPGAYIKTTLGVGSTSPANAPRTVIVYGNKRSTGVAVAGTAVQIGSLDDAATQFGIGSELYRECKAAFAVNPTCTLWGIVVAESAGTAATGTIVYASNATAASTTRITVHGETIRVAIASGDTPTVIGGNVATAINAKSDWAVTAANVSGTVTLTYRHKGPRGNWLRFFADIETACGTTVTNSATLLASGATSDDPQSCLDNTATVRFHYHATPYPDAANLAKFTARVTTTAGPTVGLREQVVAGSLDTLANTVTIATTLNEPRCQIVWQAGGWFMPGEVAAAMAAARSLDEAIDPAANLDGRVLTGVPHRQLVSDRPTTTQQNSALNAGITPIISGGPYASVCRSVTTHTLDASSNPDYRILDTAKVTITDYFADDLAFNWPTFVANAGAKIGPNPSDGSAPAPGVMTPNMARDWIYGRAKKAEGAGIMSNVDALAPALSVAISSTTDGRLDASIPIDPIDLLHQAGMDVRQVG